MVSAGLKRNLLTRWTIEDSINTVDMAKAKANELHNDYKTMNMSDFERQS